MSRINDLAINYVRPKKYGGKIFYYILFEIFESNKRFKEKSLSKIGKGSK